MELKYNWQLVPLNVTVLNRWLPISAMLLNRTPVWLFTDEEKSGIREIHRPTFIRLYTIWRKCTIHNL